MFSIFTTKDSGVTYQFAAYCLNKENDNFLTALMSNKGWAVADLKIFKHNEAKFAKFMKHHDSDNTRQFCEIADDGILKKCTKKNSARQKWIDPSTDGEVNYTAQEISDYNANKAVDAQWLIDNPNPDENSPLPDYVGISWPVPQMEAEAESIELDDSDAGVEIDIAAKLASEA